MRYFYDTEFVEDGSTIELISIGIVAEDGREYYAHLDDYSLDKAKAHEFVACNVLPYLEDVPRVSRERVAREVAAFIRPDTKPVLWGYFPSYDHVALAQLYGTMMDLPGHIPMRTNCIAQMGQMVGQCPNIPNAGAHDALSDAKWTRDVFNRIIEQHWQTLLDMRGLT